MALFIFWLEVQIHVYSWLRIIFHISFFIHSICWSKQATWKQLNLKSKWLFQSNVYNLTDQVTILYLGVLVCSKSSFLVVSLKEICSTNLPTSWSCQCKLSLLGDSQTLIIERKVNCNLLPMMMMGGNKTLNIWIYN